MERKIPLMNVAEENWRCVCMPLSACDEMDHVVSARDMKVDSVIDRE